MKVAVADAISGILKPAYEFKIPKLATTSNVGIIPDYIKHNLNDDVMIEIRDMMGKLILTSTNQSKINVSGLSTGLYNLTIKSNQIIVTKRIIKQ